MKFNMDVDSTQKHSVKNQLYATFASKVFEYSLGLRRFSRCYFVTVFLLNIAYGVMTGWSSPSIIILTSDQSPLPSGRMTMDEASWAAALGPAAGIFACFFFGYTTKHFGRKRTILFYTVPMIVCIVIFAKNEHSVCRNIFLEIHRWTFFYL